MDRIIMLENIFLLMVKVSFILCLPQIIKISDFESMKFYKNIAQFYYIYPYIVMLSSSTTLSLYKF